MLRISGTAVAWDGHFKSQIENAIFSTVIDLVLNCGTFIYIGAWLPFESYHSPEVNIYLGYMPDIINFR